MAPWTVSLSHNSPPIALSPFLSLPLPLSLYPFLTPTLLSRGHSHAPCTPPSLSLSLSASTVFLDRHVETNSFRIEPRLVIHYWNIYRLLTYLLRLRMQIPDLYPPSAERNSPPALNEMIRSPYFIPSTSQKQASKREIKVTSETISILFQNQANN